MTLANDLKTAFVNNTSWEDMEKLARERFMTELFATASDLFDPNTNLTPDINEYHRGVTELVQSVTGSDDRDDVASIISEGTATAHMVTAEDEEGVWGELEFRPEGYFYIERTKASTSEYWPYRVERYEVRDDNAWRVIDHTTGTPIGIIGTGTQNQWFKAVVNGYSQTGNFLNLRAAVIHVATEYNGI